MTHEKPNILFVDDDPNILNALKRSLRGMRHQWDLAFFDSGDGAISEARTRHFDVVVTDLAMPGLSGIEVVKILNGFSPKTRCIVLTGTADLESAAEFINTARIFRFYTKPCQTDVLIDGITVALAEEIHGAEGEPVQNNGPKDIILDRLPNGIVVLSAKGHVVYMNQSAAKTIAADDGLTVGHDRILRGCNSQQTRNLRDALQQVNEDGSNGDVLALSMARPSLRESLKLTFAPLENIEDDPDKSVIVFISDPEKQTFASPEMIAQLFELTPTESRLAREMICGRRTEEIAESLGITISTVRTYTKRIMEKTNTNRQVDLIRLLLSTPQIVAGSEARE